MYLALGRSIRVGPVRQLEALLGRFPDKFNILEKNHGEMDVNRRRVQFKWKQSGLDGWIAGSICENSPVQVKFVTGGIIVRIRGIMPAGIMWRENDRRGCGVGITSVNLKEFGLRPTFSCWMA